MDDEWFRDHVVAPFESLLHSIPVGSAVRHVPETLAWLAFGVEGLFRVEAPRQYAGWPRDSTTDGTVIQCCTRPTANSLDVAGMTWMDFEGDRFPCRVLLERMQDGSVAATGFIGNPDPDTEAPPRFSEDVYILCSNDTPPVPELVLRRRQQPIRWIEAFRVRPDIPRVERDGSPTDIAE